MNRWKKIEQNAHYYLGPVFEFTEKIIAHQKKQAFTHPPPPQKKTTIHNLKVRKYFMPQKIAPTTIHFRSFGPDGTFRQDLVAKHFAKKY